MSWLTSGPLELGYTAGKAALMYATALVGLRLSERRTLAQWSTIDFVAAVAVGAIVGRTAIASTQSYLMGAVALIVLLLLHRLVSVARFNRWFARLVDHGVVLLVRDGELRHRELHRCGLTGDDLFAQLRQRGVLSLAHVKYVLYESKGGLTVVTADTESPGELLDAAATGTRGGGRRDP